MDMTKVSPADLATLKIHARRLIKLAGGGESASTVCRASKASLSLYGDVLKDQHMPIDVVAALEADTGASLVTRELARLAGYDLVPTATPEHTIGGDLMHMILRINQELGDVAKAIDDMDADGKREMHEIDACVKAGVDLVTRGNALVDHLHRMRNDMRRV